MALEQQRGISITSTVLQFSYRGHVVNLLDTPGHRDFSEDTYRVLAAVDAAVMVLDVARGVEPQTLKLFEVCRARNVPVITFLNKCDRPGRDPLELLDEIEDLIGLRPTPVTWPVGDPGDFRGVIDRRTGEFVRFTRSVRGTTTALEEIFSGDRAAAEEGEPFIRARDECELLREVGANLDLETFLAGQTSPLFVGSALTNFGVRHVLDAVIDLAPGPSARVDRDGAPRRIDAPFSGFVFKVQANMDRSHRDRLAFVRVCSGRFERGMTVVREATGRPFATKYATSVFGADRDTIDEAWPGDVIGLVNATELRIGDTLYAAEPVAYPRIPTFAPELFSQARPKDSSRFKQFRRGLAQLEEEGAVQVLRDDRTGDAAPYLAAVGAMQFEVVAHRLEHEYGAPTELTSTPYQLARRTDAATTEQLRGLQGLRVMTRTDGMLFVLFESRYRLERLQSEHPDWVFATTVPTGAG
jgi:peptide chain release factor 3